MSQQWRAVCSAVSNLTGLEIEPQRVSIRPTWSVNEIKLTICVGASVRLISSIKVYPVLGLSLNNLCRFYLFQNQGHATRSDGRA